MEYGRGVACEMEEKNHLQIEHINKVFSLKQKELEVLRDINISIKKGEFVSIVGASGCGKSTLLRLIAGVDQPTEGSILLNGKRVEKPSTKIGMIFQKSRLFPWLTVEKNVAFGMPKGTDKVVRKELVQKHIELVGLQSFEKALPRQLSGGMQQRVSIARSLINGPEVLLLDEPFGALDALTRINMQNEVLRIWETEKTTMLLITHDIDEAIFLSDRILVMGKNPGVIRKEIKVDMARPRERNSYDFMSIRREIFRDFFKESDMEIEYYI